MKARLLTRRAGSRVAVLLAVILFPSALAANARPVLLRNSVFPAESAARTAARQPLNAPVSGLYIIQFRETPQPAWREILRTNGVDLLRYVPEHAFVARFRNAPVESVLALPFVDRIAEFRPEHKIHGQLKAPAPAAAAAAAGSLEVAVLFAPRAAPSEIAEARRSFTAIQHQSAQRAGTVLRGRLSPGQLDALARSDAVLWIERARPMKLFDEIASVIVAGEGGPNQLYTQMLGYDGANVAVAVADTGLNNGDAASMHPDLLGRTPAFFFYGTLTDAADEHSHGTHVAGIVAGNGATGEIDESGFLYGLGVAPAARIIAQRIFDGVGNYMPPAGGSEQLTSDATGAGADIGSNSWGDDTYGRYDISAMEFDGLVRDANNSIAGDQPYILEFSAGNAGPGQQTIGSPAVAKNVIATGAAQNDRFDFYVYDTGSDTMADFSSRGPAEDGRVKPDLVAPGTWIASLQSESATDENAWAPISPNYQYQGGTSQAGPHVSGAAAVFVQYYRENHTNATPSPALVKAALINAAVDMDNFVETAPVPNFDEGWGRVDLTPLFDPELSFDFLDQAVPLTNGAVFETRVVVAGADAPLKITAVYTDVPGFPGALQALVNDLDLEVVAPDGRTYRGNQFLDGESLPDAAGTDSLNNVEAVHLAQPRAGEYRVRILARRVVEDARADTAAVDQDFALVISGVVPSPGAGLVVLDRVAYRAPVPIRIQLLDSNLAGAGSVSVQARSTSESGGENVLLLPAVSSGSFTGAVFTATGPAAVDGQLQIAHGDTIEVRYFDASDGVTRTATARADLVPPAITAVGTTNEFAQTLASWQTDEPASSVIRYNTNSVLAHAATNALLTTSHRVAFGELLPGRTYFFEVLSTDEAGNTATNNNGGALFSFVAPVRNTVLLVDDFNSSEFDNDIPLGVYTNALIQAGITYEVWNSAVAGRSPATNDLRPYRLVIWRFNDGVGVVDTLSVLEQNAIRDYLNQGGSFFMASMEQLTRLGNGSFRRNVLHVTDFAEDAGVPFVDGVAGDSITAGISLSLEYSHYANIWHELFGVPDDISDTMILSTDAAPILSAAGDVAGLKYPRTGEDSAGRVVFLSFPLDAVPEAGPAPNNRATLLRQIIEFLVPGVNGRGMIALDSPAYTVPSTVTIEVGDSDLAGQGAATVTCYSDTQPGGVTATLAETVRSGLFRGTIELIAATNAPMAGKLRAAQGDDLWVDYLDASAGATVRASAVVDTVQPGLTGVGAEPDYESAIISWTTTEPANATVQFGESTFLGRTASDPALDTIHQVELRGLLPDKLYYYKVLSADQAGNVIVDDNQGNLYTFRTLQPLGVPWSDNLDTGATNWSVFNGDDAQTVWTVGVPNNDLATAAHSPPNAWGSNLEGTAADYAETFLISPAIYLGGGNVATLRFWHNYDFIERSEFDIIEGGQLLIATNAATEPVVLAEYIDASAGWEFETVDLSPYVGHVVYLVWYYVVFSLETLPRPGWLVDDVSIVISNVQPGTIVITNNLWQARYVLTGPLYRSAWGTGTTITNAPPGQYALNFIDVPWYQKPPGQTNTLASGGSVMFHGNYTFVDANANGIPDAWEQAEFGIVDPGRTRFTDTDGDGMSDWEEFMARTDPKNPAPAPDVSVASPTNGLFCIEWLTMPGWSYRVNSSTNLGAWTPASDWIPAVGSSTNYTVGMGTNGPVRFFRVEASPGSGSGLPADLRLIAFPTNDNSVALQWTAAAGRGYRLWSSTNAFTWMPASDWMQSLTTRTLEWTPPPDNRTMRLFRLEVQP